MSKLISPTSGYQWNGGKPYHNPHMPHGKQTFYTRKELSRYCDEHSLHCGGL